MHKLFISAAAALPLVVGATLVSSASTLAASSEKSAKGSACCSADGKQGTPSAASAQGCCDEGCCSNGACCLK